MRKLFAVLAVASLLGAIAAVSAFGATKSVAWKKPSTVTVKIKKGDSVKWTWADSKQHNLRGPGVSTKFITKKGTVKSHTFNKTGTFTYVCDVHAGSMKTTVVVKK
jgi:plastocyanin